MSWVQEAWGISQERSCCCWGRGRAVISLWDSPTHHPSLLLWPWAADTPVPSLACRSMCWPSASAPGKPTSP